MTEQIENLWAVYLTEYPDEGSALVVAEDGQMAIELAWDGGPWTGEPADDLTAEVMTPDAMVKRIANDEANAIITMEGQWLGNVACGQAMEIERLRAELDRFKEWADDVLERQRL